MKVLMISGDPGVRDRRSDVGKRMAEYGKVLGTLYVMLCHRNIFSFVKGLIEGIWIIWRKNPDVITAQDVEHAFLAWLLSKFFGIPWQMQIHTDIFSPYFYQHSVLNKIRVRLAKFLLPRADFVRVVSERIKKSVEEVALPCPRNKITVLPIFVDIEKIKNAPIKTDLHEKYGSDKFIILMASRTTKEKNIELAVEAMREFAHKNALLLIVGNGLELKALKLLTTNYKLQTTVVFESYTDDLASYYKTCDLFLLTSNYEGYGRTLVEAAAAGAKIVSSDVGIAPEILPPECIFKVGDKKDLQNKLTAALQRGLPLPKSIVTQTKEEYLRLYLDSFKLCGGSKQ